MYCKGNIFIVNIKNNPNLTTLSFIMNNLYRDIKSFRGINAKRFLWEDVRLKLQLATQTYKMGIGVAFW